MATVRDIHDIREIFIAATDSAYVKPGEVFDRIIGEYMDRVTTQYEYTQDDLDEAYEKGYDEGYYDGHYALREG